MRLDEVAQVMFEVCERSWELIISLLNVLICGLCDFDDAMIHDVERPYERIYNILGIKKKFGRNLGSDVLCRRKPLRIHNLLSERLKKLLCWSRWSDVSRYRQGKRTYLLHPGHLKKRLGRSRLSDVLCRRMALITQNQPSGRLKKI
jgi:hypothetical protein